MTANMLLMVHRGSPSTARLVQTLREQGYEPMVLSSAPFDDGAAFRAACESLGVRHAIAPTVALGVDDARRAFGDALDACRFCFSGWDGQRAVMAEINRQLGAPDVPPEAIRGVQDKHAFRQRLRALGLSGLEAFRWTDRELRARLARRERHIVKPRRGAGSLFTRAVTSWEEVEALVDGFERGPACADLFAEFFVDNELFAEGFFEGRELSIEMVRRGGRTLFACEHEKTVLEFIGATVLERGMASPAVGLTPTEVRDATTLAERALAALGLDEGCYHVELRVGATGECEIVEINTRVGGGFIAESVQHQFGRSMMHDWFAMLGGATPSAPAAERRCGTYFQLAYAEEGRPILASAVDARLPTPELFLQILAPGAVARGDREDIAAMMLWRTELAAHADFVAQLAHTDFVSFVYAS